MAETLPLRRQLKPRLFFLLQKRKDSHTYFFLMHVSFGDEGARVQEGEDYYTITCTYDPNTAKDSPDQTLEERLD